jgi:hypothetical protein
MGFNSAFKGLKKKEEEDEEGKKKGCTKNVPLRNISKLQTRRRQKTSFHI